MKRASKLAKEFRGNCASSLSPVLRGDYSIAQQRVVFNGTTAGNNAVYTRRRSRKTQARAFGQYHRCHGLQTATERLSCPFLSTLPSRLNSATSSLSTPSSPVTRPALLNCATRRRYRHCNPSLLIRVSDPRSYHTEHMGRILASVRTWVIFWPVYVQNRDVKICLNG